MIEKLLSILEQFGFPVYRQGSMNDDDQYPPSFFTYWNFETPEDSHYDNDAARAVWGFWVYFYTDNPEIIDTKLFEAANALKNSGWVVDGRGQDVASDEPTHCGRMITCRFIENY